MEERKQELADEVLDDKLEAFLDAQSARLIALMRERAELVERRKEEKEAQDSQNFFLVRPRSSSTTAVLCARLVFLVLLCSSRCILSFGRQAQVATPGPLCTSRTVISGPCMVGFACYVTFALCSLLLSAGRVVHFLDKLFSPVVVQRQVPVLVRMAGYSVGQFSW